MTTTPGCTLLCGAESAIYTCISLQKATYIDLGWPSYGEFYREFPSSELFSLQHLSGSSRVLDVLEIDVRMQTWGHRGEEGSKGRCEDTEV